MINIILVDDEPLILKTLLTQIKWKNYNMHILGTYTDGQSALEAIENNTIDIVFTDIKMPQMDGIELIQRASSINSSIKFIALSSYSDFPLVKKAFKAGAIDYMLKVDIDTNAMDDLLNKLKQSVMENKNQCENFSIKAYAKDFFSIEDDAKVIIGIIQNIQPHQKEALKEKLRLLEKLNNYFWLSRVDQIILVIPLNTNLTILDSFRIASTLEAGILNDLESLVIGISELDYARNIEALYQQAYKACGLFFYDSSKNIFMYNEIPLQIGGLDKKTLKNHILTYLSSFDFKSLINLINIYVTNFEKFRLPEVEVKSDLIDVFTYLINHLNDIGLLPQEMQYNNTFISNNINNFKSFNELKAWINIELNNLNRNFQLEKKDNATKMVKNYVDNNYMKELSLNQISIVFGINKTYLSRMFSKEIGLTFKEYVNTLRIEKAKSYLFNTDISVSEICEKTGFKSIEHFSRKFKSIVGMSPTAFRNQSQKLNKSL